ncbi:MAG: hypothetical protein KAX49_16610 [Halanaerobiales bacterium]|nr:hypothetical protein [Halanaerobiales bacterium]
MIGKRITGKSEWIELEDTPDSYLTHEGKFVKVKVGEDGLTFGVSGGLGDMLKAIYDNSGVDGIVDKSESIDDGVNIASAADIIDAVNKKHEQDTDTVLGNGVLTIPGNTTALFQAQTSGQPLLVGFFTKDGDGSDNVEYTLFAKGIPTDLTNTEQLNMGYIGSGQYFYIFSKKEGTGVVRPIIISTEGNTNQLYVSSDGKIGIGLVPNEKLDVDGNFKLTGNITDGVEILTITDLADAIAKKHSQNTDEYLATQVTQTFYVDVLRVDTYVENGSITRPFKTVPAAIAAATGNTLLIVSPGEYPGDFSLGVNVVSIRGAGINATFFTGHITAGDRAHSLEEFRVKSTGSLTITDNVFGRHLHLECPVILSGSGYLTGWKVLIMPELNVVPLTAGSTGGAALTEGGLVAQGDVNVINQSGGTVILFHSYAANSSFSTPTIFSNGGVLGLLDTTVGNSGYGAAISMDNAGSALNPNTLSGLTCSGAITCGAAVTIVEGLNFIGFGSLSGTGLIFRPASRIANDSVVVAGDTVKDALITLNADKLPKHLLDSEKQYFGTDNDFYMMFNPTSDCLELYDLNDNLIFQFVKG